MTKLPVNIPDFTLGVPTKFIQQISSVGQALY